MSIRQNSAILVTMNDDIRHPQLQNTGEDKNKQPVTNRTPALVLGSSTEAPGLYAKEDGFAAAKAARNIRDKHWLHPHIVLKHASKRKKMIGGIIAAVLLVAGSTGVYALNKSFNKVEPNVATPIVAKVAEPPKPTTEASRLTGEPISPELNKRHITGIMIENSPDARPQSGLKDAGVVYEAIAEGGITRFLCLFQESQPDYIGPVRSVRPYYVDLLLPYDSSIVHAGGSAEGLAKVRNLGVKDIDHGPNAGAFRRISERYAPHNLYTSMGELDKVSNARGYTTSTVKSLPRKAEKPGQAITARAIDLSISSPLYNVHYDYEQASNSYKRILGGKPHTDQRSGQQLSPKVVVALVMNYSQRGIYSVYQTTGSGTMYVFQDGVVQKGTWSKAGEREQFTFADEAGKPLSLNAGQTWISLVKADNAVKYTQ